MFRRDSYDFTHSGRSFTVSTHELESIAVGTNITDMFATNNYGYSISQGSFAVDVVISSYQAGGDDEVGSGGINIYGMTTGNQSLSGWKYGFVQVIKSNWGKPGDSNANDPDPYLDVSDEHDNPPPFYGLGSQMGSLASFTDNPKRLVDPIINGSVDKITWSASIYLVRFNETTNELQISGGFKYGFTIE